MYMVGKRQSKYVLKKNLWGTEKDILHNFGNGGDYYNINRQNGWFEYGSTPRPNSIISWSNGGYGHVAYVEGVTEDGIYISHAGYGNAWYGVQKISLDGSYGSLGKPDGFIYIE